MLRGPPRFHFSSSTPTGRYGNRPLRGLDEIIDDWGRFFEGDVAPFSWSPDLVQVLATGGLAISSGPVVSATGEAAGRVLLRPAPEGCP